MWVQENAALNLSCEASGDPQPTISWNVNGSVSRLNSCVLLIPAWALRPKPEMLPPSELPLYFPRQQNGTQIHRQ